MATPPGRQALSSGSTPVASPSALFFTPVSECPASPLALTPAESLRAGQLPPAAAAVVRVLDGVASDDDSNLLRQISGALRDAFSPTAPAPRLTAAAAQHSRSWPATSPATASVARPVDESSSESDIDPADAAGVVCRGMLAALARGDLPCLTRRYAKHRPARKKTRRAPATPAAAAFRVTMLPREGRGLFGRADEALRAALDRVATDEEAIAVVHSRHRQRRVAAMFDLADGPAPAPPGDAFDIVADFHAKAAGGESECRLLTQELEHRSTNCRRAVVRTRKAAAPAPPSPCGEGFDAALDALLAGGPHL